MLAYPTNTHDTSKGMDGFADAAIAVAYALASVSAEERKRWADLLDETATMSFKGASGLHALSQLLQVCSNGHANAETTQSNCFFPSPASNDWN
jgi:hypothetical protein